MKLLMLMIAAALVMIVLLFQPAFAESLIPVVCNTRASIVRELKTQYNERLIAQGVAYDGEGVLELYTADKGITFTVVLSLPSGLACMMASGDDWQTIKKKGEPM